MFVKRVNVVFCLLLIDLLASEASIFIEPLHHDVEVGDRFLERRQLDARRTRSAVKITGPMRYRGGRKSAGVRVKASFDGRVIINKLQDRIIKLENSLRKELKLLRREDEETIVKSAVIDDRIERLLGGHGGVTGGETGGVTGNGGSRLENTTRHETQQVPEEEHLFKRDRQTDRANNVEKPTRLDLTSAEKNKHFHAYRVATVAASSSVNNEKAARKLLRPRTRQPGKNPPKSTIPRHPDTRVNHPTSASTGNQSKATSATLAAVRKGSKPATTRQWKPGVESNRFSQLQMRKKAKEIRRKIAMEKARKKTAAMTPPAAAAAVARQQQKKPQSMAPAGYRKKTTSSTAMKPMRKQQRPKTMPGYRKKIVIGFVGKDGKQVSGGGNHEAIVGRMKPAITKARTVGHKLPVKTSKKKPPTTSVKSAAAKSVNSGQTKHGRARKIKAGKQKTLQNRKPKPRKKKPKERLKAGKSAFGKGKTKKPTKTRVAKSKTVSGIGKPKPGKKRPNESIISEVAKSKTITGIGKPKLGKKKTKKPIIAGATKSKAAFRKGKLRSRKKKPTKSIATAKAKLKVGPKKGNKTRKKKKKLKPKTQPGKAKAPRPRKIKPEMKRPSSDVSGTVGKTPTSEMDELIRLMAGLNALNYKSAARRWKAKQLAKKRTLINDADALLQKLEVTQNVARSLKTIKSDRVILIRHLKRFTVMLRQTNAHVSALVGRLMVADLKPATGARRRGGSAAGGAVVAKPSELTRRLQLALLYAIGLEAELGRASSVIVQRTSRRVYRTLALAAKSQQKAIRRAIQLTKRQKNRKKIAKNQRKNQKMKNQKSGTVSALSKTLTAVVPGAILVQFGPQGAILLAQKQQIASNDTVTQRVTRLRPTPHDAAAKISTAFGIGPVLSRSVESIARAAAAGSATKVGAKRSDQWTDWSRWFECSAVRCREPGTQTRRRLCVSFSGGACSGSDSEQRPCTGGGKHCVEVHMSDVPALLAAVTATAAAAAAAVGGPPVDSLHVAAAPWTDSCLLGNEPPETALSADYAGRCLNGGTCLAVQDGVQLKHVCICPENYNGPLCQTVAGGKLGSATTEDDSGSASRLRDMEAVFLGAVIGTVLALLGLLVFSCYSSRHQSPSKDVDTETAAAADSSPDEGQNVDQQQQQEDFQKHDTVALPPGEPDQLPDKYSWKDVQVESNAAVAATVDRTEGSRLPHPYQEEPAGTSAASGADRWANDYARHSTVNEQARVYDDDVFLSLLNSAVGVTGSTGNESIFGSPLDDLNIRHRRLEDRVIVTRSPTSPRPLSPPAFLNTSHSNNPEDVDEADADGASTFDPSLTSMRRRVVTAVDNDDPVTLARSLLTDPSLATRSDDIARFTRLVVENALHPAARAGRSPAGQPSVNEKPASLPVAVIDATPVKTPTGPDVKQHGSRRQHLLQSVLMSTTTAVTGDVHSQRRGHHRDLNANFSSAPSLGSEGGVRRILDFFREPSNNRFKADLESAAGAETRAVRRVSLLAGQPQSVTLSPTDINSNWQQSATPADNVPTSPTRFRPAPFDSHAWHFKNIDTAWKSTSLQSRAVPSVNSLDSTSYQRPVTTAPTQSRGGRLPADPILNPKLQDPSEIFTKPFRRPAGLRNSAAAAAQHSTLGTRHRASLPQSGFIKEDDEHNAAYSPEKFSVDRFASAAAAGSVSSTRGRIPASWSTLSELPPAPVAVQLPVQEDQSWERTSSLLLPTSAPRRQFQTAEDFDRRPGESTAGASVPLYVSASRRASRYQPDQQQQLLSRPWLLQPSNYNSADFKTTLSSSSDERAGI